MKKVTEKAAIAVKDFKKCTQKNTRVQVEEFDGGKSADLYLFGNWIFSKVDFENGKKKVVLRDAGWQSNTTKERLNGVLEILNLPYRIVQRNRSWYLERNGELEHRNGFKEIFY